MSYSQDNGYTPQTVSELMEKLRENLNSIFGTSYDESTFLGSNWYRFLYAAAQYMMRNEVSTSEIFLKLQEYIKTTNDKIQRPSVSYPGLLDSFESKGYKVSIEPTDEDNKGTISICVDVDNLAPGYAAKKLEICNLIKQFVAAGIPSMGTEVESIVLSNGQTFDFKFFLPTYKPTMVRVTLEISDNNLLTVPDDEEIRQEILDQILARYRIGWDFEPQKYFNTTDAPWAGEILLEYSFNDGVTWLSDIYSAGFKDMLVFALENIEVIITND